MTPCDNEPMATVDDFPVVHSEHDQPLPNGASAFISNNPVNVACITEATSIDTEDVMDLSCSDDIKTYQPTGTCEKGTQRPMAPSVPYKELCDRRKRECRSEVIETMDNAALKFVCYERKDVPAFIMETVKSKKWSATFGLSSELPDVSSNPTMQALIREYKESGNKEKTAETRKRSAGLKAKICIGNSVKNSRISLTGENTSDQFKQRTDAAKSIGHLTSHADERRRLLSIVAMDYPYRLLQELFGCSPNTVTAAKVHCILFGRGGTPPPKFKFARQCVSAEVLRELSEFFQRDNVSRASSCRSVVVNGEETPIRYWKDSVKELVNQYLLEFPNGVKRTYIYTHLPPNFRYNTMLAGLCNLCDEFGHSNYENFISFLEDVQKCSAISVVDMKTKVLKHQSFMKTKFFNQVERHSPCLELCMDHAFSSCMKVHDSSSEAVGIYEVASSVKGLLDAHEQRKLTEELDGLLAVHKQYVSHLLRTKHQSDYYKFILNNLQPGECVVIVDYKMKLELGIRSREIQRDWYGKRGLSLHGFLVVAQIGDQERRTEVIDLWSEDTKQDAWFSQSAMDVGFRWLEKELPGFHVYLFSGEWF